MDAVALDLEVAVAELELDTRSRWAWSSWGGRHGGCPRGREGSGFGRRGLGRLMLRRAKPWQGVCPRPAGRASNDREVVRRVPARRHQPPRSARRLALRGGDLADQSPLALCPQARLWLAQGQRPCRRRKGLFSWATSWPAGRGCGRDCHDMIALNIFGKNDLFGALFPQQAAFLSTCQLANGAAPQGSAPAWRTSSRRFWRLRLVIPLERLAYDKSRLGRGGE